MGKRKTALSSTVDRRRKRKRQAANKVAHNSDVPHAETYVEAVENTAVEMLPADTVAEMDIPTTSAGASGTSEPVTTAVLEAGALSCLSTMLDRVECHLQNMSIFSTLDGCHNESASASVRFAHHQNAGQAEGKNVGSYQETSLQHSTVSNSNAESFEGIESEQSEESDTETGVQSAASRLSTAQSFNNNIATASRAGEMIEPVLVRPQQLARPQRSNVGGLTIQCRHCSAYHFHSELSPPNSDNDGHASFSSCCLDGKVVLTPQSDHPPLLRRLFYGQHILSSEFKDHIRQYNNALAFTSMVADAVQFTGRGPYTFNVHGQVYHYSSCLEPRSNSEARFAQLYILDSDMATDIRIEKYGSALSRDLMDEVAKEINSINPFAKSFKMMKQVVDQEALLHPSIQREIVMVFDIDRSRNSRTHNIPVDNEIAAVFVTPDGEVPTNRGIIVNHKDNRIRSMPIISPFVDPMTYPLLFPRGDRGWHPGLLMNVPGSGKRKRVTMRAYYGYLAHYRAGSVLHLAGKLFQQFLVDVFCKVEENELNFIRLNQKKLRAESYMGLMDHINNEAIQRGARVGRRIILPSSFTGGLRNKTQHYQDSMGIVTKFGKPDFFLTFTCNPQWPEIVENLLPGQKPHDRPDLVARVFKLKLDELREDLVKKHVLGHILAHVGVIEFQKRGLPHAHLLLTLHPDHKLLTPEDIDKVVSAEIPSPTEDPEGHAAVLKHLIHGPCGDHNPNCPCMVNGGCSKSFPKPLNNETVMNVNGFTQYRRRNQHTGKVGGENGREVDDSWVVPFNRYLLLKYNAHINVEVCASIKCVKYLYKYIFKGHDAASLNLRQASSGEDILDYDEVQSYIETRYVGSPEAAWRLFRYRLQEKSHAVIRLAVHCQDMQSVVFEDGEEEEAIANASNRHTTLTAYFQLNQNKAGLPQDPDDMADPRNHLYIDIPNHFTFSPDNGWTPRRRFNKEIGRMHFVSPADSERFHLRLLLLHVRGAVSFESLRTVNGVCHNTYKEAASALGLTEDDEE